jgi:hypothetical protein
VTRHFGADPNRPPQPARRYPFSITVMRDDEPEVHHFLAAPRTNMFALARLIRVQDDADLKVIDNTIRLLSSMLDNKDGVPNKWKPEPLPDQATAPTDDAEGSRFLQQIAEEEDPRPPVQKFRGPDGKIYPMDQAEKFLHHTNGSSRRRWRELIEEDDDVTVEFEDLKNLMEWMVSIAGKGHTPASS